MSSRQKEMGWIMTMAIFFQRIYNDLDRRSALSKHHKAEYAVVTQNQMLIANKNFQTFYGQLFTSLGHRFGSSLEFICLKYERKQYWANCLVAFFFWQR